MDKQYLSKLQFSNIDTIYFLKDIEARNAVSALETALSTALIFKGNIADIAELNNLTSYKIGWVYRISTDIILEENNDKLKTDDLIIATTNSTGSFQILDWLIIQNKVEPMKGASEEEEGTAGLVPAPIAGDNIKYLRGDGTWAEPFAQSQWGKISDLIETEG